MIAQELGPHRNVLQSVPNVQVLLLLTPRRSRSGVECSWRCSPAVADAGAGRFISQKYRLP